MTGVHAFFPPSLSLSRDRSCGTPRLPYRGLIATTVPFFAVLLLIEGNRGPELRRGEDNKRIRAKLFEVTVLSSSSSLRDELFLLPFFFFYSCRYQGLQKDCLCEDFLKNSILVRLNIRLK